MEFVNNTSDISENKDYSRIVGTFLKLDFVGYGDQPLNEKNQFDNLFNDALHCFYGAHCDIYVTKDKKSIKKTKAVYQDEQISTRLVKSTELSEYIMSKK